MLMWSASTHGRGRAMSSQNKDYSRTDPKDTAVDEDDVAGHIRRPTLGDGVSEEDDVQGHLRRN
jgi:hypothetical protein